MVSASKFQKVMNHARGAGVSLCLLAMAGTANATFIDLTGSVTGGGTSSAEPAAPFSSGDQLTGFIEIDDDAATAGSSFDVSNLLDFNVDVGPANFNLANSAPFGFFNGTVSSDGNTLTMLDVSTDLFATDIPGCGSCGLTLNGGESAFVVSILGLAPGVAEGFDLNTTVRQQAAAVPEPSSVLLFGAGLLGLVLTRIRRS